MRGPYKKQPHCKKGHLRNEANVYWYEKRGIQIQICRRCRALTEARRRSQSALSGQALQHAVQPG